MKPRTWRRLSGKQFGILLAITLLAVVAAANAHLVYVAVSSQPECAPHFKSPQANGTGFRAAKPAC